MLIVADENMPLLDEFFGSLGELRRVPGRSMAAADVAGADLLLVRSVTRVDAALLGRASPRFVGSATIGTDHVDLGLLAARGIPFAAAPGCNARAVGEWVATVLALHGERAGVALEGLRLGVVGCGNVGRAVVPLARALGLEVAICDPFLAPGDQPPGTVAATLDELLAWADVLTLHVPLTRNGPAPTWHLLDEARLRAGRWQLLINAARGPVVDNRALDALLAAEPGRRVVLDVWEDEPVVPANLLGRVWLGTPHVAGYSLEGKWRGTEQVYRAACAALGVLPSVTLDAVRRAQGDVPETLGWPGSLAALLGSCCGIGADDARLRAGLGAIRQHDTDEAAKCFDRLRRDYPVRREFPHFRVETGVDASGADMKTPRAVSQLLAALGFGI